MVTGGAGFIGANLVGRLVRSGREVVVLDDLSAGRLGYLEGLPAKVIEGSITDRATVRRAVRGCDAIVHLAAFSGVAPSVAHPDRDFEVNVRGMHVVLEAARAASVPRMVFASSGAVLAGARPPLHEGLVPSPRAPYGASKAYGESALQAFSNAYGFVGVSVRFSNVYGPFCSHKRSIVPSFVRRALRGEPLIVYGDGKQTRDFLHVDDATAGIAKALAVRRSGLYHLGTGVETSVRSMAGLVAETVGVPLRMERRDPRPGEATRNVTDPAGARSGLRWQARVSLPDGLEGTVRWMRTWRG